MKDYRQQLKDYLATVENILPHALKDKKKCPLRIEEATAYSLLAGGKRIRPILSLAVADMLLEDASQLPEVQNYAAAIEMIHCYSLIHDDLPAMDDDAMRRGKPSNHKVYGEAMAILAGDALLTKAFSLLNPTDKSSPRIDAKGVLAAWGALADYAGKAGMIGGQVMDIEAEGRTINLAYLEELQSLKTSCLIQAAVVGSARLLHAPENVIELLDTFALYLGRAFQIQDDILDVEADPDLLGKTVGKDAESHKATYVTLLGLEGAKLKLEEVDAKVMEQLNRLNTLGYEVNFLHTLHSSLSGRRY